MVYATDEGNLHLDHALNISVPALPSSIERALTKALKSFERACSDASKTVTILGYAAAAYLVMSGVSRLMEARYNKRLPPPSTGDDDDCVGRCKRNAKRTGKSLDVTEEWEETEEWERDIANNPGLLEGIP